MQKRQFSEPLSKKACLLEPNQVSELIMDSDSNEPLCDVVTIKDEKYCGKVLLESHLRSMSGYAACSSTQAPLCPDSVFTSEEADGVQSGPDTQTQQTPNSRRNCPLFTGPNRKELQ